MILQETTSFWTINLGHLVEVAGFGVAALAYYRDRRNDSRDRTEAREKMVEYQARMHQENKNRLELLFQGQTDQRAINFKRDEQVNQLMQQTATLTQIAKGLDRRLQMVEDRG